MSRKITDDIVGAFLARRPRTIGNSHTDGTALFLHGNMIARHDARGIMISNAGWSTNTTKERLNGIPGVSISQKDFVWYLNGKAWNGDWVAIGATPPTGSVDYSPSLVIEMATKLVKQNIPGWKVETDPMLPRGFFDMLNGTSPENTLGQTRTNEKVIALNSSLIKTVKSLEVWRYITLHEIAHAIVESRSRGHGHDEVWAAEARKLGVEDPGPTPSGRVKAIISSFKRRRV